MNLRSLLEELVNKPECYSFFIETNDKEPPMDIINSNYKNISLPTASRTPNCLFKFCGTYKSHFTKLYWYGNEKQYNSSYNQFIINLYKQTTSLIFLRILIKKYIFFRASKRLKV
jgi:hypothetical protein